MASMLVKLEPYTEAVATLVMATWQQVLTRVTELIYYVITVQVVLLEAFLCVTGECLLVYKKLKIVVLQKNENNFFLRFTLAQNIDSRCNNADLVAWLTLCGVVDRRSFSPPQSYQLEQASLHDTKRTTHAHTRACADQLLLLGRTARAVQLLLETEPTDPHHYEDSLRWVTAVITLIIV